MAIVLDRTLPEGLAPQNQTPEGEARPYRGISVFEGHDSVDVSRGPTAEGVLALDQGTILAAIANALCNGAMQHLFSDGNLEATVRPLIADEKFTARFGPADHSSP